MLGGAARKLWNVSEKLENGVPADKQTKRSIINDHRIRQPSPIIKHDVVDEKMSGRANEIFQAF